eukprot:5736719-Pleurochrysis_carterae.AAC.2
MPRREGRGRGHPRGGRGAAARCTGRGHRRRYHARQQRRHHVEVEAVGVARALQCRLGRVVRAHLADGDGGAARRARRDAAHKRRQHALARDQRAHRADEAGVASWMRELPNLDDVECIRADGAAEAGGAGGGNALRQRRLGVAADQRTCRRVEALCAARVDELAPHRCRQPRAVEPHEPSLGPQLRRQRHRARARVRLQLPAQRAADEHAGAACTGMARADGAQSVEGIGACLMEGSWYAFAG